jgi:glycosyltransferase involved in cell wall biosynthesis
MKKVIKKRKLKIAQIAPLWVSVPPKTFGGIEKTIHLLVEELVKRNHGVTLFAAGNSKTSAELSSIWPISISEEVNKIKDEQKKKDFKRRSALDYFNIIEALKRAEEFDIIHSHIGEFSILFAPLVQKPILVTQHNPFFTKDEKYRYKVFKALNKYQNYVSVSLSQQKEINVPVNFAANIYNGIEIEKFKFNKKPSDYLFWMGRINKFKGVEEAIIIAKKNKRKLFIAGSIEDKDLFNRLIKNNKSNLIEYLGELNFKEKVKFFAGAKVFLYPIQWEEPFGLVMIEAMACGTPVIAFNRGAVPEVIKDGKTGFIVDPLNKKGKPNIEGLVKAIKKIDQIDRKECRKHIEENFTIKKMVDNYEKVYYFYY